MYKIDVIEHASNEIFLETISEKRDHWDLLTCAEITVCMGQLILSTIVPCGKKKFYFIFLEHLARTAYVKLVKFSKLSPGQLSCLITECFSMDLISKTHGKDNVN